MILRVLQIVNCVGFAGPDVITCTRAPSSLAPRAHPRVPKVGAHLEPEDLPLIRELLTEDEYAEVAQEDGAGSAARPAAGLPAGVWRAEREVKTPNTS